MARTRMALCLQVVLVCAACYVCALLYLSSRHPPHAPHAHTDATEAARRTTEHVEARITPDDDGDGDDDDDDAETGHLLMLRRKKGNSRAGEEEEEEEVMDLFEHKHGGGVQHVVDLSAVLPGQQEGRSHHKRVMREMQAHREQQEAEQEKELLQAAEQQVLQGQELAGGHLEQEVVGQHEEPVADVAAAAAAAGDKSNAPVRCACLTTKGNYMGGLANSFAFVNTVLHFAVEAGFKFSFPQRMQHQVPAIFYDKGVALPGPQAKATCAKQEVPRPETYCPRRHTWFDKSRSAPLGEEVELMDKFWCNVKSFYNWDRCFPETLNVKVAPHIVEEIVRSAHGGQMPEGWQAPAEGTEMPLSHLANPRCSETHPLLHDKAQANAFCAVSIPITTEDICWHFNYEKSYPALRETHGTLWEKELSQKQVYAPLRTEVSPDGKHARVPIILHIRDRGLGNFPIFIEKANQQSWSEFALRVTSLVLRPSCTRVKILSDNPRSARADHGMIEKSFPDMESQVMTLGLHESLTAMAHVPILIAGGSGFSRLGAVLNPHGAILSTSLLSHPLEYLPNAAQVHDPIFWAEKDLNYASHPHMPQLVKDTAAKLRNIVNQKEWRDAFNVPSACLVPPDEAAAAA